MYEYEKVWIGKYFEHKNEIIYLCLSQNICYGYSKEPSLWLGNMEFNLNNYYNYKTNYDNILKFPTLFTVCFKENVIYQAWNFQNACQNSKHGITQIRLLLKK